MDTNPMFDSAIKSEQIAQAQDLVDMLTVAGLISHDDHAAVSTILAKARLDLAYEEANDLEND